MSKLLYAAVLLTAIQLTAVAGVKLYPAPQGENKFENCALKIDGKNVDVYECNVSKYPINQVWPGYQRPIEQTEKAGFAYWDMDKDGATVEITTKNIDCRSVVVRPLSLGIKPKFSKNKITFKMDKVKPAVVEINGYHNAIHLFPSPMQDYSALKKTELCAPQCSYCSTYRNEIPRNRDPNYYYFKAGRHDIGTLLLKSNDRVHIEAGAVVYGSFVADDAENIKITGRGILDGSKIERADKLARGGFGCLHFRKCKNVSVEGIILRDPNSWCVNVRNSSNVDISNIKMIGLWRYNSDGIDVWNSENVSFKDSFIRAFDDSFIIRADVLAKNIRVENCAMWNDWGLTLAIWAWAKEIEGKSFEDIVFKNVDIIRTSGQAMHISNKSGSAVRNVKFENINVECDAWCARQILQKKENRDEQYVPDPNDNYVPNMICIDAYGKKSQIENIGFENVNVLGRRDAPSYIRSKEAECPVKNVSISNFKICGKDAKDAASANLKTKNAEGVVFK